MTLKENFRRNPSKKNLCSQYGDSEGSFVFRTWFGSYTNADIIDTGAYDCHSEAYMLEAMENADLMEATLDYVPGSNLILEKLVSGRWDQQFLVIEPGNTASTWILYEYLSPKALRPVRFLFPHEVLFMTVVSALRCEGASFCCIGHSCEY